jgi:hypothetical protein
LISDLVFVDMLDDVRAAPCHGGVISAASSARSMLGEPTALLPSRGGLRAYLPAPGAVLCCVTCGAVQVRMVRAPDRAWLDFQGVQALQVEMPSLA